MRCGCSLLSLRWSRHCHAVQWHNIEQSTSVRLARYTVCSFVGLTAATQTHTKIFFLVSVYRSCDVRVYGKDSVQYVSMAKYSLHKLIFKLIPQDKGRPCNAHQAALSFNLVSLYLSHCLQWPCPPALHCPALLSQHQSEVSQ